MTTTLSNRRGLIRHRTAGPGAGGWGPTIVATVAALLLAGTAYAQTVDPAHARRQEQAAGQERTAGRAADAVDRLSDEEFLRLTRALADPEAKARLRAVAGLASARSDRAQAALVPAALSDRDVRVREEAVHGLGQHGGPLALRHLELALLDPEPTVREAAVAALGDVGGAGAANALSLALGDEQASIREATVYALEEIGGASAVAVLHQALADDEESVREAAVEALAETARGR